MNFFIIYQSRIFKYLNGLMNFIHFIFFPSHENDTKSQLRRFLIRLLNFRILLNRLIFLAFMLLRYILLPSWSITEDFHLTKSPASICVRASSTSLR
ncbi:unknown [Prevotella sp. CAG:1124]|nr:unknown [Prevotella sp. CAG:1124]